MSEKKLVVSISRTNGMSTGERAAFLKAMLLLEDVVNGPEFKAAIIKGPSKGYLENKGLTGQDLFDRLMSGNDVIGIEDGDIDVDVTMYLKKGSVIGYTYFDTVKIWANRHFWGSWFKSYNLAAIAGNVAHEVLGHKTEGKPGDRTGFTHNGRSSTWPRTVPYFIGDQVVKIGKLYMDKNPGRYVL